ncbi:Major intrinsic protein [Dirofilaria immitis]|nr:Major intrinsic protein [Dirofilaria immitis]
MHHMERFKKYGRIEKELARNLLAEFYGTALLRFIGTGVMAQFVLSRGTASSAIQINLGWGLAIALSVYVAWETSGGHVNPAVTAALFILGKISLIHSLLYCIAQTFGAACGAAIMYLVHSEAINAFDGGVRAINGPNATAIIFASFPRPYLSNIGAFIDQKFDASSFGIIATTISMCCGLNMGSPVNPASDFGARIFASMSGYGIQLFTLIPSLLLPCSVVGAYCRRYDWRIFLSIFIGFHIPKAVTNVNEEKWEMDQDNQLKQISERLL